jgi:hypothetical protein
MSNTINLTYPVTAIMIVAAIVLWRMLRNGYGTYKRTLYLRPKTFLTKRELVALPMVEAALPGCRIHAQVSMGALIQPDSSRKGREYWRVRGYYAQKIVDFVAQDRSTGQVIALIELDDRSHSYERDSRRDAMTAAAGYITIRLGAGRPTYLSVKNTIHSALGSHRRAISS